MGELNPADSLGPGERPSTAKLFGRAALKHCPRCGAGNLFTSWWTMKECCPSCNLNFEGRPEEGHFLGAITINTGLTATILLLGIWLYVAVLALSDGNGPSVWFVVATSAALAVILPALFYPFTKTIWVATEITLNRMDPDRQP
ncbi:MAG TPA: hypothetical protein VGR20_13300 [Acidimicrobiia bacterium]|jgi:uncharacterized protein (DUF983 family)|nr:hypothetical protein [Acidimicrobiia bacterium]